MKKIITYAVLFLSIQMFSQSSWKEFHSQSRPIKVWIVFHPFKAKKAQLISKKVIGISDSIANTSLLDGDKFNGQVDAFRHAYWMASLKGSIGKCASKSLGRAYERSNKRTFKKNKKEGRITSYDRPSKKMDLLNNRTGLKLFRRKKQIDKNLLIYTIVTAIKKGEFKVLSKNSKGDYLNCEGEVLTEIERLKWNNKKCIVPSNQ